MQWHSAQARAPHSSHGASRHYFTILRQHQHSSQLSVDTWWNQLGGKLVLQPTPLMLPLVAASQASQAVAHQRWRRAYPCIGVTRRRGQEQGRGQGQGQGIMQTRERGLYENGQFQSVFLRPPILTPQRRLTRPWQTPRISRVRSVNWVRPRSFSLRQWRRRRSRLSLRQWRRRRRRLRKTHPP